MPGRFLSYLSAVEAAIALATFLILGDRANLVIQVSSRSIASDRA
jgi:hypothetical protein